MNYDDSIIATDLWILIVAKLQCYISIKDSTMFDGKVKLKVAFSLRWYLLLLFPIYFNFTIHCI